MLLRAGNAGSNTAADHITVVKKALAQLPCDPGYRVGRTIVDPHRWCRRQPRVPRVSDQATAVVLDRVRADRRHGHRDLLDPAGRMDTRLRRRRAGPRRRLGCRTHRSGRPVVMAGRDAACRAQGTPSPWRAAAVHRPRRAAVDRVHPPTPATAGSPTSNYATAAAPGARTASGTRKPPAWRIFRCTDSTRTGSGSPSCNSPANSSRGPRCSPCTSTPPGSGSRNGCACACGRSPGGSPTMPAAPTSNSPPEHPGPAHPRPRPPQRATRTDLTSINPIIRDEREMSSGAVDPDATRPCRAAHRCPTPDQRQRPPIRNRSGRPRGLRKDRG